MIEPSLQTKNAEWADSTGGIAALFAEACRLQRAGCLCWAKEKFLSILRLDPEHADSLHRLGIIAARGGQYGAAIEMIQKAIAIDDTVASYYLNLANAFQESGYLQKAIATYRRAIEQEPGFVEAYAGLGTALEEAGLAEEAILSYRLAIKLNPNVAEIFYNLGIALRRLGRLEQAAICHRRAIELKPEFAQAYFNLGNILRQQGKLDEAIICHRRAIALKPDFAQAYTNLGSELEEAGQQDEAIECYRTVVALQPHLASGHNNLGSALHHHGPTDEVLACFRRAIALQPDYAEAYNNLGNFLQEIGQLDEAYSAYEQAVELAPRRATFHRMLANTGRVAVESKSMQRMEDLAVDMACLAISDQIELHFALATVYSKAAVHERSFRHLLRGNRLKRQMTQYNEADALGIFQHIQRIFTETLLDAGRGLGQGSRLPIFVVGMPRSGTTLVEQILASHPQVHGAGELSYLPGLVGSLAPNCGSAAVPEALDMIPEDAWGRLGAAYLERLQAISSTASRIVDKLPDNFLRIGLIRLALPNAQIIHVQRDPFDTCLSCFSILFTGHLPYTYDMAELGRFYRAYQNLMAHWRRVLPQSAMLEVQYESLVTDFENQAKRIFAYCDLPWHENCLDFHKTPRLVQTASVTQVRQPLYTSSVGRWQVYRDMAAPLIDALAG